MMIHSDLLQYIKCHMSAKFYTVTQIKYNIVSKLFSFLTAEMYKILKYRQNYQLEQVKLEDFLPAEAVLLRLPKQTSQRKHNFHFPLVDKAHNS